MSCGCGFQPCNCGGNASWPVLAYGCNPNIPACNPVLAPQEPVSSQLENLSYNLFGPFQVQIVNNRGIWAGLCSLNSVIAGFPRNVGEGFICYILRYLSTNPAPIQGVGSPNGVVAASPGALYVNTLGGPGTTLYVKESGVGTATGWVGK
jgi:hypothetical protein